MHAEDQDHEKNLRAIAHLVHTIRPYWDTPGIMAALRDCPTDRLADTAIAALICARDRTDQATPAVIAREGSHWRTTKPETTSTNTTPLNEDPRCETCFKHQSIHHRVMNIWPEEDRHPFQPPRRLTNQTPPT